MTVTMPLFTRPDLMSITPTEELDANIVRFSASDFAENFDTLVDAAGSATHLRALILALALQGRLSSRQASDGTARDASAAALHDRSWRIGERPSKPKLDPKIEALAGKTPVPKQWVECRLDDCAQLINGRAYAQPELLAAGTPVIRIQNLNGGIDWYYSDLVLPDKQYCENGDLLFAWSASFGPYIWSGPKAIYHYHIWKVNLSPALDKRFLFFSLMHITDVVREQSHGLAMLHMTKGQMERWPLLLPPLAEQKRIVARVDQLMALIDDLEAKQTKKRDLSTRFTKAALEALTTAESPEAFDTAWQRVVENFPTVIDRVDKVDELRRTLLRLAVSGGFSASDTATWQRATIADVADCRLGKMLDKVKNRGTPRPYLRNTNVHWFRLELGDIKEMRFEDDELGEYELRTGDLVVCEGGHGIGRTAVWQGELKPMMFQKALHRLRPKASINSFFLAYQMKVATDTGTMSRYFTGAGIPHLTGRRLAEMPVNVPLLAEQERIVAKVEHLMKLCDDLEAKLRRAEDRASKLVEAVVQEMVA